jgi:hypothetical protein
MPTYVVSFLLLLRRLAIESRILIPGLRSSAHISVCDVIFSVIDRFFVSLSIKTTPGH